MKLRRELLNGIRVKKGHLFWSREQALRLKKRNSPSFGTSIIHKHVRLEEIERQMQDYAERPAASKA